MPHHACDTSIRRPRLRLPMVAVTLIVLGGLCSPMARVAAQPSQLSRELGALVRQYAASWDTHDASALAAWFTADADMIMGTSPILDGRTPIQEYWREYFSVQEPERRLTIEVQSVRAISADVALANVHTITGGRTAQGVELSSREARGTWVLVRVNGRWLVASMRGMPTERDRILRSSGGSGG